MPQLNHLGLPIALAVVLSTQPLATAGDVEKQTPEQKMAQDIKDIKDAQKKTSDELMEQLRNIREQLRSMEGLRKDVEGLKTTVQSINTALELTTQQLQAKTKDLDETRAALRHLRDELERTKADASKTQEDIKAKYSARCDALTDAINNLEKRLSDGARQSARITEGTGTGTIRLYNTYGLPVRIVVNGRSYPLEPGETYTLSNQPVGSFTYEVLGLKPPQTVTLNADRPFEIEVFDRAVGPIKTRR
jgi:DNA mismatch repair ATPase MutS